MAALRNNRLAYLSTSFVLYLIALPLISVGATSGPRLLLWIGFAALCVGSLIPPVYRLIRGSNPPSGDERADETEGTNRKECRQ